MSDNGDAFWKHFDRTNQNGETTEEEYIYKAWREIRTGETVTKLLLVPSLALNPETWRIPYLQIINHRYNRQSGQLCLMFPSSDLIVFIDGRGLDQLEILLENRRVRSIHMFDETIHQPVGNDTPVITNIAIEQISGNLRPSPQG